MLHSMFPVRRKGTRVLPARKRIPFSFRSSLALSRAARSENSSENEVLFAAVLSLCSGILSFISSYASMKSFLTYTIGGVMNSRMVFETKGLTSSRSEISLTYCSKSSRNLVRSMYQFATSRISGVSPVSVLLGFISSSGIY